MSFGFFVSSVFLRKHEYAISTCSMSIELLSPPYVLVCLGEAMELPSLATELATRTLEMIEPGQCLVSREAFSITLSVILDNEATWVVRLLAEVGGCNCNGLQAKHLAAGVIIPMWTA